MKFYKINNSLTINDMTPTLRSEREDIRWKMRGLWWMLMLGMCMLWNVVWGQEEKKKEKRINLTIQAGNYFLIHDNYYSYELADITGKRISSKTKYKEQPFVSVGGQVWISKWIGFEIDAKFWSFNHYKTFESPLRYSDTGDILAFQIVNNRIDLEAGLNLRFINKPEVGLSSVQKIFQN